MSDDFWIDWSDRAAPVIRRVQHIGEEDRATSLAAAKVEIIDVMHERIKTARAVIEETKALRPADIPHTQEA